LRQRSIAGIAILLVVATGLACSVLRPKKPLTWQVTLKLDDGQYDHEAAVKLTINVLKTRLNAAGVYNFEIQPQGDPASGKIDLKLPEVVDRERLKQFLTAGGKLELTPVISPLSPAPVQTYQTLGEAITATRDHGRIVAYGPPVGTNQQFVVLEMEPVVTGRDLRSATAVLRAGSKDEYSIAFTLRNEGATRLRDWTKSHINSYLAVVLNDIVVSVASIKGEIFDSGEITGRYSKSGAEDLARVLNSGELPAQLRIAGEGAVR
jgi:protein-export membrane protein SecD